MRRLGSALILIGIFFDPTPAAAQPPPIDFAGFGWGVGFAFNNSLTEDIVNPEDVEIVGPDRILQVAKVSNISYGMVFESHVTFQWRPSVAVGPYVSVTTGNDELIQAAGLGILFELNRPSLNPTTNRMEPSRVSFNVGVGVNVLLNVNMLRSGLKDGFHVPEGINPVVQREKAVLQLMTVFGF